MSYFLGGQVQPQLWPDLAICFSALRQSQLCRRKEAFAKGTYKDSRFWWYQWYQGLTLVRPLRVPTKDFLFFFPRAFGNYGCMTPKKGPHGSSRIHIYIIILYIYTYICYTCRVFSEYAKSSTFDSDVFSISQITNPLLAVLCCCPWRGWIRWGPAESLPPRHAHCNDSDPQASATDQSVCEPDSIQASSPAPCNKTFPALDMIAWFSVVSQRKAIQIMLLMADEPLALHFARLILWLAHLPFFKCKVP